LTVCDTIAQLVDIECEVWLAKVELPWKPYLLLLPEYHGRGKTYGSVLTNTNKLWLSFYYKYFRYYQRVMQC